MTDGQSEEPNKGTKAFLSTAQRGKITYKYTGACRPIIVAGDLLYRLE